MNQYMKALKDVQWHYIAIGTALTIFGYVIGVRSATVAIANAYGYSLEGVHEQVEWYVNENDGAGEKNR